MKTTLLRDHHRPARLLCRGSNRGIALRWFRSGRHLGFSLMELLVVISIIGVVAAISLPAIKTWNKSNIMTAATRQLLDDLDYARRSAISRRSTVYVVFAPPARDNNWVDAIGRPAVISASYWGENNLPIITNILKAPYACYAVFVVRQVGDQPGTTNNSQYLTQWRTLPEGIFIATNKFDGFTCLGKSAPPSPPVWNGVRAFDSSERLRLKLSRGFPFPTTDSAKFAYLPFIAFDHMGRLLNSEDEVIPLARGVCHPALGAEGMLTILSPTIIENPPFNSIQQSNHIRVDRLTGRARVERWEAQ